jgi:hypothetical protein
MSLGPSLFRNMDSDMNDLVLVLHLVSTCIMVGVIWFVQLVHYPLLAVVPVDSATQVAEKHQRWTGFVVGPPMAVEGVTTLLLWANTPLGVSWWLTWANGAFLAVALLCTIFLSVPRHARMVAAPDAQVGRELVQTNWPRTVSWTICGFLAAVMLIQGM